MMKSSIPVDLLNPGQVFACLGLMECAFAASDNASENKDEIVGQFDIGNANQSQFRDTTTGMFVLECSAGITITDLLSALTKATVRAFAPMDSDLNDKDVETLKYCDTSFPARLPEKTSALPIEILTEEWSVSISSWAESNSAGRNNAKFWAGNYSGAGATSGALELIRGCNNLEDPFNFQALQSSSFRLDWRRDYSALDAGFSPNKQGHIAMVGYPFVELLAAIGLENARPLCPDKGNKLYYHYAVPTIKTPLTLMRAALGGADLGLPLRRFSMTLDWPGKEGQARYITDAQEIT